MKTPITSNDNQRDGLILAASAPDAVTSVSFHGSRSLYTPAWSLLAVFSVAVVVGVFVYGYEAFLPTQTFRLLTVGGGAAVSALFIWGFLKRRTLGLHTTSRTVRLSAGFPSLKLHELPADSILSVQSRRGLAGRMATSGTITLLTESGERFVVKGLENSDGAHAFLSLQIAAAKAAKDKERLRQKEVERRSEATTPHGVLASQIPKSA